MAMMFRVLLMVVVVIDINFYNAVHLGASIFSVLNSIVSIFCIIDIVSIHLGTRRSGRVCQRPVTVSKAFRMGMLMLTMNGMILRYDFETIVMIPRNNFETKQLSPQQLHVLSKSRQFLRKHRFLFPEHQPEVQYEIQIQKYRSMLECKSTPMLSTHAWGLCHCTPCVV